MTMKLMILFSKKNEGMIIIVYQILFRCNTWLSNEKFIFLQQRLLCPREFKR